MNNKLTPFKIVLLYTILGGLWILFSDTALMAIVRDPEAFTRIAIIKGWVYVIVTAYLLYWLIRRFAYERKKIEEEFVNVFERITDGFVALDNNWRYTYVNKKAAEMFSRKPENLIGRHIWTEFPEGIDQPFYKAYYRAMEEQKFIQIEEYYPPYDRWFENRIYPSKEGLSIFFQDVTERKKTELALRETEERFRAIASNTPDHVLMQDSGLRYQFVVNPQLGLTERDMIGKTDHDFLSKDEADRLTKVKRQVLETGKPVYFETSLMSMSGELEYFDGTYVPRVDSEGRISGLIGYFRNITGRKRAEEALRESEERLHLVIDGLGPHMFVGLLDTEGVILAANRPALEAAGLRLEDVLGKPVHETYWFTYSDDVSQRFRAAVQRSTRGETVRYDEQIRVAEGQLIWVAFTVQPVRDGSGNIAFLVPSAVVIHERKLAEEELHITNKELLAINRIITTTTTTTGVKDILESILDEIRKISPGIKTLYTSGYTMGTIDRQELIEEGMNFIQKPVLPKDLLNKVREILDK